MISFCLYKGFPIASETFEYNLKLYPQFDFKQHHLKRMHADRKVATSQTSELVGKAPKTCNSYPDAIFK